MDSMVYPPTSEDLTASGKCNSEKSSMHSDSVTQTSQLDTFITCPIK